MFNIKDFILKVNNSPTYTMGKLAMVNPLLSMGNLGFLDSALYKKINLDKKKRIFIQFTEGIKVCPIIKGDVETGETGFRGLFYLTGPGAVIDLNINIVIKL